MKKIITIFAVVSLFLTGCSTQEKPKNKSVKIENKDKASESEKTEEKKEESSEKNNDSKKEANSNSKEVFEGKPINHDVYYDAYKSIIEGYASYVVSGKKDFSEITDENYNGTAIVLYNQSTDPNKSMEYTLYDINNDNVAELLIQNVANGIKSSAFAVYTLENGNPKRLFTDDSFAVRTYLQFHKNGNILVREGRVGMSGSIFIYNIKDFKEVEEKVYFYQMDKYPNEYFTEDRSEVYKVPEFNQMTQEWQPIDIDKLDWRPIK